ncbi:hypothetical protein [Nonomuraea typhae]|uniref:hypothetical protein n=1 Tax=Nonomuraea typhae TaxID=2603600 RepID=UPI0012FC21FC|nr:hypothetical protein [Nonomuraea typhae]
MPKPKHPCVQSALWDGVLAIVAGLPKETPGTSRSIGEFTVDGATSTMLATYSVKQPDGSNTVYTLTLSAVESQDDHDWFWGPGGERDRDDPSRRVVVDGTHYVIGKGGKPAEHSGFAGRTFNIAFFDGRAVSTKDLWYQGPIPPKWRHRFPDNARFVQAGGAS